MTTILVTGGAGYIGSHACKALAAAGYVPVAYDNLSRGHDWAVKWGPLEQGDIADRERLAAVIQKYRPTAVMHFAAYSYVGESVTDPEAYYRNNAVGSLVLLETMRAQGIRRFVFSSTCATYGLPEVIPISEDTPQLPVNPYGTSKLMVERMCLDFASAYGLQPAMLRYFNAAGADPGGEIGEQHDPETHLIPIALEVAAGQRRQLTVYGNDYDTPDGTCIRDYIHVTDLAEAHVLALRSLEQGQKHLALNLGTGQGFSVQQVIDAVRAVTQREVKVEIGPRRPGDPPQLVADARRAQQVLAWKPRYRELNPIIETAWRWLQKSSATATPGRSARSN